MPRKNTITTEQDQPCIQLPVLAEIDADSYLNEYCPTIRLTPNQRKGQRLLVESLKAAGSQLKSGKVVDSPSRAVQWIFEQVSCQ